MQIYSKNNKNCFFSLISWPILIWFALSGRAKFGTLNFYIEFEILFHWLFMVLYANEMKLCPFQGIKFLFFDQFKVYHIKFTIFVVARCGWVLRHWRSGLSYWIALCRRDRRERFPCLKVCFQIYPHLSDSTWVSYNSISNSLIPLYLAMCILTWIWKMCCIKSSKWFLILQLM